MFKIYKFLELSKLNLMVLIFILLAVYLNSGFAIINKRPLSYFDSWFDRVSYFVSSHQFFIKIVARDAENLKNVLVDIDNPFENDLDAIKSGKKYYALKGCGSLHCHGPKGKGSGGPALNKGIFKHSDGSNYALLSIITNGIKGTRMSSYGNRMTQDDILKIIAYLRSETIK